ncbi:2-methoxy-6-polyprenyl-1,4-benzoquinol methylase, mitochondrial [subsurface metagenome]|nr:methyltransferase domain-containing protein [Dehalococcoidia bacterium]
MESKKQVSLEEISKLEPPYFELQAYWGITKHYGGLKATRELIELCHINKGKYVLDVGCGVGVTSCCLAKRYGCRVVGVDLSERMIDRSNERAKREGVEDRAEFRVADAQNLSFEDILFDVVICESVNAFVEDKQRAVSEYVRVTKPGGYIGLNECTWIKAPPPTELVEYLSRIVGVKEILTSDGWQELLGGSGLRETVARIYKTNALGQFINRIRQLGLKDYLRGWHRFLSLYIASPSFRRFIKEGWPPKNISKSFFGYLGYGIYVGRK